MLHPSTKRLIDKLDEMTAQRRIDWTDGEDNGVIYDAEGYRVALIGEPAEFVLYDPLGNELERTSVNELVSEQSANGRSYADVVSEMQVEARRIARGTEHAIDRVMAGLEQAAAAETVVVAANTVTPSAPEEIIPEAQTDETEVVDSGFEEADVGAAVEQMAAEVNAQPEPAPEPEAPAGEPAPPPIPAADFSSFGAVGTAVAGAAASVYGSGSLTSSPQDAPAPEEPLSQDAISPDAAPEPEVPAMETAPVPEMPAPMEEPEPASPEAMAAPEPEVPATPDMQQDGHEAVVETVMPVIEDNAASEPAPSLSAAEAELAISNAVDVSEAIQSLEPAPEPEPAKPAANSFSSFSSFGSPSAAFGTAAAAASSTASSAARSVADTGTAAVEEANNSIQGAFGNGAETVAEAAAETMSEIAAELPDALDSVVPDNLHAAASTLEAVSEAPAAVAETVQTAAGDATGVASETVTSAASAVTGSAASLIGGLAQTASDTAEAATEAVAETVSPVKDETPEGDVKPVTRFNPWN